MPANKVHLCDKLNQDYIIYLDKRPMTDEKSTLGRWWFSERLGGFPVRIAFCPFCGEKLPL